MQQIIIEGLAVETLIGVYDWERTRTTTLELDVVLHADLKQAMLSDNVSDTIDYAKVAEHIQKVGKDSKFELLEALGNAIIESVLANYPVSKIQLTIVKPGILPDAKRVAVKFTHQR